MQLLGSVAFAAITVVNATLFVLVMAAVFKRTRAHY
jgi:hypothetical protein